MGVVLVMVMVNCQVCMRVGDWAVFGHLFFFNRFFSCRFSCLNWWIGAGCGGAFVGRVGD